MKLSIERSPTLSFTTARRYPRLAKATLILGAAALTLSACAQPASTDQEPQASGEGLSVVASTDVYQDLAQQVLGEHGTASAIVTGAAQDPHSYEASPQDKLSLEKADVIVANGGGYDPFIDQLTHALKNEDKVIEAFKVDDAQDEHEHADEDEHDHDGDHEHDEDEAEGRDHDHDHDHDHAHGENEHVWYDLGRMEEFVEELGERFAKADPDNAAAYTANAEKLAEELGALHGQVQQLKGSGDFLATEPVAEYLLLDAGYRNVTNKEFLSAVEHDRDLPPVLLKEAEDTLKDKKVKFLSYNTQTETSQTVTLKKVAEQHEIPVLDFTENLPEGKDYVEWMKDNIQTISELGA